MQVVLNWQLRRVPSVESAAIAALQSLYNEVFADLDADGDGIRWMRDQLDWQRACLIGNYYMSAISGVQSSLRAAAFSAKRYRQKFESSCLSSTGMRLTSSPKSALAKDMTYTGSQRLVSRNSKPF
jgi:hypothetical protein